MPRLLVAILPAGVVCAQTSVPETKDPLGRNTPQDSVFQFLEACHARDYSKALYYLDLRRMPPKERAATGPELARQLEDLDRKSTRLNSSHLVISYAVFC